MSGEMKDSGIEWAGQVPASWTVTRGKFLFQNHKDVVGARVEDFERLALTLNGVIKRSKDDNEGLQPAEFSSYQILKKNELVFKLIDLQNISTSRVGLSPYTGIVSPAYIVLKAGKEIDPRYAEYYYLMMWMRAIFNQLGDAGVRSSLNAGELLEISLPLPPLSEQHRIADFLDSKCSQIDEISKKIQAEIDTLEEYKNSVITEAVTKGLDPNVEMKDSGIEWIGTIPAKWNIHPVFYYYGERKNKNVGVKEQNLLSLSYGNIIRKDINTTGGLLPASFSTYNIVEPEDIIIRPTDLQNDKRSLRTGLVKERGIITSAYIDLMPVKDVNSEYFHYLLHTYDVMKVFYNMGNGVRQGLNYEEFGRLMVFEPDRLEQDAIVSYLNEMCDLINKSIETKKQQLSTLEEYKKSLIYEYVTGKKEVA